MKFIAATLTIALLLLQADADAAPFFLPIFAQAPTATSGLTAKPGTAATFMRSDAAPAIDQSISPKWTGTHDFSGGAIKVTTQTASDSSTFAATDAFVQNAASAVAAAAANASNLSSGTVPSARLPAPSASSLGGVKAGTAVAHQFLTAIGTNGGLSFGQPAAADVSGLAASATTDTTNAANIASGTLSAARLPTSGVVAGSYLTTDPGANFANANDRTASPVVDTYGRMTGLSVSLITAAAFGDVYGMGGTVARNLASHFFDHLSIRDFGAVCDGSTDDTTAINNALKTGFYIELPQQTCAFAGTLVFTNPYSSLHGSGMWGASRLLYTGASTTADLLVIGSTSAPTNTSGVVSQGFQTVEDVLIESNTKMTAGAAVRSWGQQFISFRNVALGRQGDAVNLWNGFSFNQIDAQRVDGYFVAAQNDGFQAYGFGAEPGSGNGTGTSGSGAASGPQYEVWIDNGRVQNAHAAFHVGGGIDGVYVDHTMATNNDYDLLVDNALSPHPNQEIVFGSQAFLDGAHWDTVLINDPKCVPAIMCEVSIQGPVLHAGTLTGTAGVATGSFAGQSAPANSGNGVHIYAYPGGTVDFQSSYSVDYANAAVFNEDAASVLFMNPAMHVGTSPAGAAASPPLAPKGIVSTIVGWAPKAMPSAAAFANVATPLTNVATPDLTSATGGLKVGLGAATNNYAPSVVSNRGAEGVETACGAPWGLAAGVCRELYYNRSGAAYATHQMVGQEHDAIVGSTLQSKTTQFGLGGTHIFGFSAAPTFSASTGTVSAAAQANDAHGTVTASAAATITIKFSQGYYYAPDCVVNSPNGAKPTWTTTGGAAGTASLAVTTPAGEAFTYICMGQ